MLRLNEGLGVTSHNCNPDASRVPSMAKLHATTSRETYPALARNTQYAQMNLHSAILAFVAQEFGALVDLGSTNSFSGKFTSSPVPKLWALISSRT